MEKEHNKKEQAQDVQQEAAQQENQKLATDAAETMESANSGDAEAETLPEQPISVEEKLQQVEGKLADMDDRYRRVYAEYENYRKRTNAEKADLILNGGKEVLKSILPIIDDLERALQSIGDDNASAEGIQLIYKKLLSTLGQKGLRVMEAKNCKFDEELHEAVARIPAASEDMKGMVVDEVEKGYYLNDKVLRYAKVVVAV